MRSILLLSIFVALPVTAQKPDSTSALSDMLGAELNFAQTSVMHGRNAAFIENFAEESVIFTDKWITNGKQYWKVRKETPVVLKWEPEFMDIANSRDFGISTGPWEAQEYRPNTKPLVTGYFITVWKKQSGVWKVILDAGSNTPAPASTDHRISFPAEADKVVLNSKVFSVKSVCNELTETEKQMLMTWKNNPVPSTYASFLAKNVRIQSETGHLPITLMDSINVWLGKLMKTLTWSTEGSGAANSGDLGFTYGYFETQDDIAKSSGHYVRFWKKQPDARWAIILEMMNVDRFTTAIGQ